MSSEDREACQSKVLNLLNDLSKIKQGICNYSYI